MRLPLDWSCPRDGLDLPSRILITGVVGERTIYSATELEGLAVVDCIDHFTPYMSVTHFLLEHRAISFLNSARLSNGRLAWWSLNLQPYSFDIKYRCGRDNVKTNALSHLFEGDDMPLVDGLHP